MILIDDLVDNEGHILTHIAFSERYLRVRVNPLTYMGWCHTVPSRWKYALVGSASLSAEERNERCLIKIKDKDVALCLVKSGYYYALQMPCIIPTAQTRWTAEGVNFQDWEPVYERAFKTTKTTASTKLQSPI